MELKETAHEHFCYKCNQTSFTFTLEGEKKKKKNPSCIYCKTHSLGAGINPEDSMAVAVGKAAGFMNKAFVVGVLCFLAIIGVIVLLVTGVFEEVLISNNLFRGIVILGAVFSVMFIARLYRNQHLFDKSEDHKKMLREQGETL